VVYLLSESAITWSGTIVTEGAIALALTGSGSRAIRYRLAPDRLLGADGLDGEDAIGIGGSVVREHGVIHSIEIIFLTKRCVGMSYVMPLLRS
jgi:hypothetical protein